MQATAEWLDIDYYDVLGVDSGATTQQIKSAYRKLARTAHPDANPDDPSADERFSDIAKAYEVLGDDSSRSEYDGMRSRPAYEPSPSQGFGFGSAGDQNFDMADLYDLFGSTGSGGYTARHAQPDWPVRGGDLTARLQLDFMQAVNGTTTTLALDGRSFATRIPAGVDDGQTIRLAGKGQPGSSGGPAGDLFIEISVRPHAVFGRSGRDLTVTVPISYSDAVLGGEIDVPMLDGDSVTIKIPAGTATGKAFRLSGKGLAHGSSPGHVLVTVTIDVPTDITDEHRALLESLRDLDEAA